MRGLRGSAALSQGIGGLRGALLLIWVLRLASVMVASVWPAAVAAVQPTVMAYTGNQSSPVLLSRTQLRDIFLMRVTRWLNGERIRVFVLPDAHPLHVRFAKEILGVFPYQLRAAWDRMVYSGTGVPPTVVESPEELRRRIDETPGAIGYLEE